MLVCVFVTDNQDDMSLPDYNTINDIMLYVQVDTSLDNNISCTIQKYILFYSKCFAFSDSVMNIFITCAATDDDSVENTSSIAMLEVYQDFDEDIKYCFHGPKIIAKNEPPATICMVNTIRAICSRQLLQILLDLGASCCLIK